MLSTTRRCVLVKHSCDASKTRFYISIPSRVQSSGLAAASLGGARLRRVSVLRSRGCSYNDVSVAAFQKSTDFVHRPHVQRGPSKSLDNSLASLILSPKTHAPPILSSADPITEYYSTSLRSIISKAELDPSLIFHAHNSLPTFM
jgi:hypothetical protein